MIKRTMIVSILAMLIVLVGVAVAGNKGGELKQDRKEISYDKKVLAQSKQTLSSLEHAIDLWHDANLKGDDSQARKYMVQIQVVLQADLECSRLAVKEAQKEKVQSGKEVSANHPGTIARHDDRQDAIDDRSDALAVKDMYKVKKRLLASITRGPSFSNRYRLLGDYADMIRREIGMANIELAENIGELKEDRKR